MRARILVLIPLLAVPAACGSSSDEAASADELADRLQQVADDLGQSERLEFSLTIDGELPDGVQGLESAEGFGNRTPAFDGDVTVQTGSTSIDAEVVAVDGQVWAKLPFTSAFVTMDPDDFGAPDPAALIGLPDEGLVSLLPEIDIDDSSQERDGKEVLTTIEGTVPGSLVAELIPSADSAADFDVTVRLTEDDELHDVTLSGAFYPDADDVTYVVTVSGSDESAQIEAP